MMIERVLAASALVLTAAALDPLMPARALGLLLLLLCGAASVWRWSSCLQTLPADRSLRGSKPDATSAAGMTALHPWSDAGFVHVQHTIPLS